MDSIISLENLKTVREHFAETVKQKTVLNVIANYFAFHIVYGMIFAATIGPNPYDLAISLWFLARIYTNHLHFFPIKFVLTNYIDTLLLAFNSNRLVCLSCFSIYLYFREKYGILLCKTITTFLRKMDKNIKAREKYMKDVNAQE